MTVPNDRLAFGNTSNPPTTRVNDYGGAVARGMGKASRLKDAKPVFAAHDMIEQRDDSVDVAKMAKLYAESVGFENLAGDPFVYEQALAAVLTSAKDVITTMQFLRNKWLLFYRLYRGESISTYDYGRMRLHSPTPFKVVETLHPRVMRSIFGGEQFFKLYGEAENHDIPAEAQEALCRQQLRACNFKQKQSQFVRDGLIYGTAIQKTYWRQDPQERAFRVAKRIPDPKIPGGSRVKMEEVKRMEMMFDGNDVTPISIFRFQGPPAASSIDEAEWCMDRSMWPDYRVKQMVELGHWRGLESLERNPGTDQFMSEDPFEQYKAYSYGLYNGEQATAAPGIPHYEVADWWGPLVIKHEDGHYTTRICNVVVVEPRGQALVARVTVNPFWHGKKPYQVWRPIELQGELFGIGALEMIARLSIEKDVKRQLLMAATQLESAPMMAISDQSNLSPGQLLIQPGLILRVPSPREDVVPIQFNAVSDSALKAENILEAEMREISGVTSPVIGTSDPLSSSSKTATQFKSELDEANERIAGMISNHDIDVTVSMLEQMTWNNMQFQSYEKTIRDIGPMGIKFRDRVTIRPEDLIGRFIVQPLSGYRLTTKRTQVQQMLNLLDRGPIINQMYGPNAVKMPKLLAHIMEVGFDIRNVDEFIQLPPDEARLLTALEEEELWYHGSVPPRRPDDNDMRHVLAHFEEFKSERFAQLEESSPATAAMARAHAADHLRKIALQQEQQEKMLMDMAQAATAMNMAGAGGEGGGASPDGAAGPGQEPGSPKVRKNENKDSSRNGSQFTAAKSEGMTGAPNPGAE